MSPKVIVVTGPTASGKTKLSIELAKRLGGEIVSADSMQIYRGMDIGTAKANAEEKAQVPHHMLDVADPGEDYSVARYVEDASKCCDDILARGKIPVITGGTGLYIDSLLQGRNFACKQDSDEGLRQELMDEYDEIGGEAMLSKLREFDPERAAKLAAGDKRRIVRAVEVYMLTGISQSEHDRRTRELPKAYDAAYIILNFKDRAELYKRIDERVDIMISHGLYSEVQSLLQLDLPECCTAMQAIGYKEPAAAIRGEISRERARELIQQSSRRYAKRQLTWFRKKENAHWINWDAEPDFEAGLKDALDFIDDFRK